MSKAIPHTRIVGSLHLPRSSETKYVYDEVRCARGVGRRWVYCKYCYKNVTPMLGGRFQIVCSECDYALSPDFETLDELRTWLDQAGRLCATRPEPGT